MVADSETTRVWIAAEMLMLIASQLHLAVSVEPCSAKRGQCKRKAKSSRAADWEIVSWQILVRTATEAFRNNDEVALSVLMWEICHAVLLGGNGPYFKVSDILTLVDQVLSALSPPERSLLCRTAVSVRLVLRKHHCWHLLN